MRNIMIVVWIILLLVFSTALIISLIALCLDSTMEKINFDRIVFVISLPLVILTLFTLNAFRDIYDRK